MNWSIPMPCGKMMCEFTENKDTHTAVYTDMSADAAEAYFETLKKANFICRETKNSDASRFAAFDDGTTCVFVNFYFATSELTVVAETNSRYFDFSDVSGKPVVKPQITQIALEDFGLSYAIRLADGRFIIFDGGWENEPDADKLMNCLKRGTPHDKPVIAAWIMTHPHVDHYRCFIIFMQKYASDVVVEKMLYTFPGLEEIETGKGYAIGEKGLNDGGVAAGLPRFFEEVKKLGVPVYAPHSGQHYGIGEASLDILSSPDDDVYRHGQDGYDLNCNSLVIRMRLAGQTILWCADAQFDAMRITARYGNALKADILQVPHHGFGGGTIESYKFIKPEVCFIPVSDQNCYLDFCRMIESSHYLMRDAGIGELIAGSNERTITLPYHAPWYAARDLEEKVMFGEKSRGSKCWYFSDEYTGNPEDMRFTITSLERRPVNVTADICCENGANSVGGIKIPIEKTVTRVDFLTREGISLEASKYNRSPLYKKGLPENDLCTIRFLSDKPIIVSQKNHADAYHV